MADTQTTNRWHQTVRQQLGMVTDASTSSGFNAEVGFVLQFEQLMCAWLQELSGQEFPPEAASFEQVLSRLMGNDPVTAQIAQISDVSRQPGSWLYEFVMVRRSILSHQIQRKTTATANVIAVQSGDEYAQSETYRHWLVEFEQWLESFRELNQEY